MQANSYESLKTHKLLVRIKGSLKRKKKKKKYLEMKERLVSKENASISKIA